MVGQNPWSENELSLDDSVRRAADSRAPLLARVDLMGYFGKMSDQGRFTVKPAEELSQTEAKDAKTYWSSLAVPGFYKQPETHWSKFMADQILSLKPQSVLEFGCNVGRNLLALRESAPTLLLRGIDINPEAVTFGRTERGLDLAQGDETFLAAQSADAFDVIFTVSVMDHLPDPLPVLREMVRVARLGVLLLEPTLGAEGKVLKCLDSSTQDPAEATPYSYAWDYARLCADLKVAFSKEHYPLSGTKLGPYYWLYHLLKE
jgi:SAM-dependent methyltransferase